MLLDGRVAVVSGVGPGLGRSIALALAREGASVALAARSETNLKPVAEELEALGGGRRALWRPTDVSRESECQALVDLAVEEFGSVDIVVNSAASFGHGETVVEGDLSSFQTALDVCYFGALHLTRAAAPWLRAHGDGRVIMVGSMATRDPQPGEGAYAAAKSATLMAVRTLATELGPDGVRVNAVNPGYIQGEPIQAAFRRRAQEAGTTVAAEERRITDQTALRYLPGPDEIAGSVVFLASPLSRPVTGHVLDCNAGMWM